MDNQELVTKKTNKIKPLLLFSLLGIVILVAIIILVNRKGQSSQPSNQQTGQGQNATGTKNSVGTVTRDVPYNATSSVIAGSKVIVPGANAISPNNQVITATGAKTDNSVAPMSENAPKQTDFLVKESLSNLVWQITVGYNQFSPKEITTTKNAPTTFSLTSSDNEAHYITFDDSSLSAILIFVGPQQTKAITFNAPGKAGEYTFRCGLPGHADKGEVGKMIVK